MLLIKQILKKLSNNPNNNYIESKNKKYTIIKFDVSNSCCTSQADNDFVMSMKQLSYVECIEYLFKECETHFPLGINKDIELNEEDEDNAEILTILCNGFLSIINSKRLCMYECECGLDYFIFDQKDEIIVDKSDFYNYEFNDKYTIFTHFEF